MGSEKYGVQFPGLRLIIMKLISLNTWGGKLYKPLMDFIKENSNDTDIFCFQEVFDTPTKNFEHSGFRLNIYNEIANILNDFQGFYAPTQDRYIFYVGFFDFDLSYGLACFVRKNIKVSSHGDFFVFRKRSDIDPNNIPYTLPKNVQYINLKYRDKNITICNFHGIWIPMSKQDSQSRIKQSKKIKQFLDQQGGEKILCGDFNLDLNTKSIKILEGSIRNLIREYQIPTTRNKYFPGDEKFADYVFVSDGIKVIDFQVPNVKVSDHLPLILEFS